MGLGLCYYLITTSAPAPCGYGFPSAFLSVSLSFAVSFICYCFTFSVCLSVFIYGFVACLLSFFLSVFRSVLRFSSLFIFLSFALSLFSSTQSESGKHAPSRAKPRPAVRSLCVNLLQDEARGFEKCWTPTLNPRTLLNPQASSRGFFFSFSLSLFVYGSLSLFLSFFPSFVLSVSAAFPCVSMLNNSYVLCLMHIVDAFFVDASPTRGPGDQRTRGPGNLEHQKPLALD